MIILNLISEKLRKEIKLKYFYQLIKKINYILIIIFIAVTIILLIAKIILQNNFIETVEQTVLITKNNLDHNNKAQEINNKLKIISTIQNDFSAQSKIIENLSTITPVDITFNLIKIDFTNKNIKIRGEAKQRAGLLELKNNLEKSDIFTNIEFPTKNLLEKENINFEINANFNHI